MNTLSLFTVYLSTYIMLFSNLLKQNGREDNFPIFAFPPLYKPRRAQRTARVNSLPSARIPAITRARFVLSSLISHHWARYISFFHLIQSCDFNYHINVSLSQPSFYLFTFISCYLAILLFIYLSY